MTLFLLSGTGSICCRASPLRFAARIALIPIWLCTGAVIAFADEPPKLNVGPSCEAAARGAIVAGRNKEACMSDEDAALDELKNNWSKYASIDKVKCVGTVRSGGPPSYVELLSCMQIMRDARTIQAALPTEERIPDLEASGNSAASTTTKSKAKTYRRRQRSGS